MKLLSYLLLSVAFLYGCSPKVKEVITQEDAVKIDTIDRQEPLSPCAQFKDIPGIDREQAETAFVLYRDQVKLGKYKEALIYWKQAYNLAPGSNGRVKYHFEDGAAIYKHLFDNTVDKSLKKNYVDTIMMIYDKRKECFGDEAYVNGLKAFDYYYYFSEYTTQLKIFELFKSNFDVKGKNADYFVINPFTKLVFDLSIESLISKEEGSKYAKMIFQAIDNGTSSCKGKACETWEIINDYAPVILESLEGLDDFYQCDYYKDKYYTLFKTYPDSCDIINLAYSRMLRGNCLANDPKLVEVKKAKEIKCYVAPPPLSCAAQGNEDYSNGKYTKAVESFLTCVEGMTDSEQKAKYLILIAKIYYRDIKNFSKARKYALDAAKEKQGWGEPYMLIGNLYASSGPLCGPGRGWDSQVVTWPAIDMWTKARAVDSKVYSEATNLINRYKQYMPTKEDIFFRQIKNGDSYFVPCWIQESTIVRTSD